MRGKIAGPNYPGQRLVERGDPRMVATDDIHDAIFLRWRGKEIKLARKERCDAVLPDTYHRTLSLGAPNGAESTSTNNTL